MIKNIIIPGEFHIAEGVIVLNVGRKCITITVINDGDRPIQIGSHFHFYEVNVALKFDRLVTLGFRLDIASGTAVRFEPGQSRTVDLVQYLGKYRVFGFCKAVMGDVNN